jgi:hypothetical protein
MPRKSYYHSLNGILGKTSLDIKLYDIVEHLERNRLICYEIECDNCDLIYINDKKQLFSIYCHHKDRTDCTFEFETVSDFVKAIEIIDDFLWGQRENIKLVL